MTTWLNDAQKMLNRAIAIAYMTALPGLAAPLLLTACGKADQSNPTSDPLAKPDESDTTLLGTGRKAFEERFGPDTGFQIGFIAKGVKYVDETPKDGESRLALNRSSLCFGDEDCFGTEADKGVFTGVLNSFVSPELLSTGSSDPEDSNFDPEYDQTEAMKKQRSDGRALSVLYQGTEGSDILTNVGGRFVGYQNVDKVGMIYPFFGVMDAQTGAIRLTINGAATDAEGHLGPKQADVVVPVYTGPTAPTPQTSYTDEVTIILQGGLGELVFSSTGQFMSICSGDCSTVSGSSVTELSAALLVSDFQ